MANKMAESGRSEGKDILDDTDLSDDPIVSALQTLRATIDDIQYNDANHGTDKQTSAIAANTAKNTNVVQTSVSGNAGSVTNGVYLSGSQTISGGKTFTGNANVTSNLYANRYIQNATGVPTNNLGSPTVTEMALFEHQFKPQTTLANAYDDLADLTFFTRASGTSESDYAEVDKTDDQKRKFLRTNNSACYIPNGHNSFRIEFVARYYQYANAMIAYWSSQSHKSKVQVYKRRCSDNAWIQHTSSDVTVSSWPGHLYLPFGTIPWHETNTSSTGHYNKIRIEFTPTWKPYSGSGADYSDRTIAIYGMQIWGGYPSGRRTVHSYDQNGKLDLFKDLGLPDNGVATFGNSDDLKLYHDGSNSYIEESGSGNLKIRTSALNVMNAANSENMLSASENGAVTLYHNNASKLTTVAAGVEITGELQADTLDIDGNADISGNITSAMWAGDVIASNKLDADTAHLSTTQTFSGTKTFSNTIVGSINGNSATTSETTITSGQASAITANTAKVGFVTTMPTATEGHTVSVSVANSRGAYALIFTMVDSTGKTPVTKTGTLTLR